MPHSDHFHAPVSLSRQRESFHSSWATEMMAALNRGVLPPGSFVVTQVHIGSRVEIDVAIEREVPTSTIEDRGVAVQTWSPLVASPVMPTVFQGEIEGQVFSSASGAALVATIELVSPGNKVRPESRRAFAATFATYLQMGIGLVIVDIETGRQANRHDEPVRPPEQPECFRRTPESPLYSVAHRPIRRDPGGDQVELWPIPFAIGQSLPIMPPAFPDAMTVPLDLEATDVEARQRSRLS